jgi:uncharacterized protein YndB with AHSA1/START domain
MGQGTKLAPDAEDRKIVNTRVISASPGKVFEAFRNPDILARWWGPENFTNTFQTFDFNPGGIWEFIMHGPDGTNYPNKCVFLDIVESQQVVFDYITLPTFRMTVSFQKVAGVNKTHFGFCMLFECEKEREQLKNICIPANEQSFDRLEAVLVRF